MTRNFKLNLKCLLTVFLVVGLSLNALVKCDNDYNLSFQTNAEMVYEYSYVNITLLIQLALEDFSYSAYYTIPQGFQVKWIITSIVDNSDLWIIRANVYRGESFNERAGDFETLMYRNPEDLSYDLYNGTGNMLYFIPVSVNQYLDMLNQSIPTSDQNYSFALTNTIVFDYTQLGGNDTIKYNYNEYGLMSHYQIFYNGSLAFSFELKSYSLGGFNPLLITVIISLVSSAALIPIYFVLRRRRPKKKTRTKSLLKKIR